MHRHQLTLFIPKAAATPIEAIRSFYNPAQYALIKAHVTLCREDEIVDIEQVIRNLAKLRMGAIPLDFGPATRFSDGKGVMLPAIGNCEAFHQLRASILQGTIEQPRHHEPHVTLMHPRNSICTDSIFEEIEHANLPRRIWFNEISLIRQEMGMKWHVLETYSLQGS